MKIIYTASDILEANIVAGLLKANAIDAYAGGLYLQGGIGDLAAMDFANVFVADEDEEKAQHIIDGYEKASAKV